MNTEMSATSALTKAQKFDNFVNPVIGVEPYESFFRDIGERSMSTDRKVRIAARREWFVFMRVHAADYLRRWPEACEDLITFVEHLLEVTRKLRPQTRADAEAVLTIARMF